MNIVVIAGGVGGARYLKGLEAHLRSAQPNDETNVTAIVNVGDDVWFAGLRITPDLDSIMYALAGENDEERGWGRRGETERVNAELAAYGLDTAWFTLGDLDIGTHLVRTHLLREGVPLHEVAGRLCTRWGLTTTLLPATNDQVETHVHTDAGHVLHFQEWWVRHRANLTANRFEYRGAEESLPTPGVVDSIMHADRIIIAPSNPVVSVGAVLAIPGIRDALARTQAPIVGISPVIGGSVVRGMADACLAAIGVETRSDAIALHYGSRSNGGLLDAWLVDSVDATYVDPLEQRGIATRAVPLWMDTTEKSEQLAHDSLSVLTSEEGLTE